jgi:hypothetical protein
VSTTAATPRCDFCNCPDSRWLMSCSDITFIIAARGRSASALCLGAWAACDGCLVLIQRGDADALADRVARTEHAPLWLRRMSTLKARRAYFAGLYRRLIPKLEPARPLTLEIAARWAETARTATKDESGYRAVAATLERTG